MVSSPKPTLAIYGPQGVEGTPDFKLQGWSNGGKNQNPKKYLDQNLIPKKSHADFPSHKNFQSNTYYTARIRRNYHESSDCFEYPKKFLLKSSYPKFSYPNKIPKSKIPNPQKILRSSLNLKSGAPPPPCPPLRVMDPGTYKHFILTFVKQTPQSPRWTLFLGYRRIDSINKVAVTLSNL